MTLEEFLAEERARLDRFAASWREEAARQPDRYPLDLEPSDWDEALMTFSE